MSSSNKSERYYALDALRGIMMLLGIVIHAAAFYGVSSPIAFHDESRSGAFDHLAAFIHAFRMPVFFVMAGFFASLLYGRRGAKGMILNRVNRVLIPLVVSWLILYPLTVASFIVVRSAPASPWLSNLMEYFRTGHSFVNQGTHLWYLYHEDWSHLWFLYYLLIFYAFALGLAQAARWFPQPLQNRISLVLRKALESSWRPLIFALVTVLTTYPSQGIIRTDASFVPDPLSLLGYGVFFGFGWVLFGHRELLITFQRHAWALTFAGVLCFLLRRRIVGIVSHVLPEPEAVALLLNITMLSLVPWLFIFGLTGLFIRYLNRPTPLIRYLSDASYWIYLVHPPVLVWLAWLLAPVPISAVSTFLLLLLSALPILVLTYHYGVRSTFIGEFLNGRRYYRPIPNRSAEEAAAVTGT